MKPYRGWTKDTKRWIYGNKVEIGERCWIVPRPELTESDDMRELCCSIYGFVEVDPKTVGQFTSLKDKNGKEIYFGDKYKWYQPLVEKGKQIRKEHILIVTDDIVELFCLKNRSENDWGGVEVTGNIHEPELLEGDIND